MLLEKTFTLKLEKCLHRLCFKRSSFITQISINKTRTSRVGAISKAQKAQKTFFEKKLENFFFRNFIEFFFRKTKKMDWVARRGPLARAPGALKEGHFRNCQHFCCSWRRNPLEKKQIFEKKTHNAQKTERGDPLGFLNTQCVVKYQRNWRGTLWRENNFRKKSHSAEKNWKEGPFGIFQHPFCRKTAKNWRGDPLETKKNSKKKSHSAEKNSKGGPYCLVRFCILR